VKYLVEFQVALIFSEVVGACAPIKFGLVLQKC
jgi:hypothetical protein